MIAASLMSRDPGQVGVTITAITIGQLRRWLNHLGVRSTLIIERSAERNWVGLRLSGEGGIDALAEARLLHAYRLEKIGLDELWRRLGVVDNGRS